MRGWILFVILTGPNGEPAATTASFMSKAACENAATILIADIKAEKRVRAWMTRCLPNAT